MKDAIGGIFTLQAIVVFMILVNSYMAFSVNYTKAFRVKNEIRSIIEKNEGLTCDALEQINVLFNRTKYSQEAFDPWCKSHDYKLGSEYGGGKLGTGNFCFKFNPVNIDGTNDQDKFYQGGYYTIATFVNVDIPIINKILPFAGDLFLIKGETSLIYSSDIENTGVPTNRMCAGS